MEVVMEIGIGLPSVIPDTPGTLLLHWARKAELGPFSSLSTIDRVVFPNYSPLIALAGVAAITQRLRLMTSVLLAPLYQTALLAKEAASLDALSGGRLTLGLGIGGREDDYLAVGTSFHDRGKRFDDQLAEMKRIWSGERLSGEVGPIGPTPVQPAGPPLLIGGYTPIAIQRVARWGDGFLSGGRGPSQASQNYKIAEQAWVAAGRTGKPRFVAATYFALGPNGAESAARFIGSYYSYMGPAVENMVQTVPSTPEALKNAIQTFTDIGVDELLLWPTSMDLEQIDRVTDLVG
jgi:alkanesulfonate monooxygenase SsuD/methylene tetrahydromethanopterin reductase-like flavin-dependent oxidoreductase (luciferase family)